MVHHNVHYTLLLWLHIAVVVVLLQSLTALSQDASNMSCCHCHAVLSQCVISLFSGILIVSELVSFNCSSTVKS